MSDEPPVQLDCLRCGCPRFVELEPKPDMNIYNVRCESCGDIVRLVSAMELERGKPEIVRRLRDQLRRRGDA